LTYGWTSPREPIVATMIFMDSLISAPEAISLYDWAALTDRVAADRRSPQRARREEVARAQRGSSNRLAHAAARSSSPGLRGPSISST
jgi:hypothetical protein